MDTELKDKIDKWLIDGGIVRINEDLSVDFLQDEKERVAIEDKFRVGVEISTISDTRKEQLKKHIRVRKPLGWTIVRGEESGLSDAGAYRSTLEALCEFPEFDEMLDTTPGLYKNAFVYDTTGEAVLWVGLRKDLL